MSVPPTGNATHDAAVLKAEGVRQVAVAAATTQAAARSADIAFYQTAIASAKANGLIEPVVQFEMALKSLNSPPV